MNVLVIPEDFRKDQFILLPIIRAMFSYLRQPAIVEILRDPLIGGIGRALDAEVLRGIVRTNQWKVDLFILCVDRDGEATRRESLDGLESTLRGAGGSAPFFVAENAWQELEVWVLAGHDLLGGWSWQDIREERDPKEAYFQKLVAVRHLEIEPGQGRKTLGMEAARRYLRVRRRCLEDIQVLEARIAGWLRERRLAGWVEARAALQSDAR